jgi:general nucleoside transport system permease protein
VIPAVLRFEPRLDEPRPIEWTLRLMAGISSAIVLGSLVIAFAGQDPLVAFAALWRGGFGSSRALAGTLNKAVPIGLCALGIALAYRARLWNIGAEGQLYFGAFAAAGTGLWLVKDLPPVLAIPLVLVMGALGGAFWALLAALPRALLGVSEILSTLMLNYVAILWVNFLVVGPWADPLTFSFPYSPPIAESGQLPKLGLGIHWGFALLLVVAGLFWFLDLGSRAMYEARVAGDGAIVARYAGISSVPLMIGIFCSAGALAGLAGAVEVAASTHRLQSGLSPGYGFMAILVTWLAAGRPLAIVPCAIFYAGLLNGGFALQVSGIPPAISTILQPLLLLCILASLALARYRLRVLNPGMRQP